MKVKTMLVLAFAVVLCGCASKETKDSKTAEPDVPRLQPNQAPALVQEAVSPRRRAELHTDLALGYYERGRFDVALEELAASEKLDPTYAKTYGAYGLVYTMTGEFGKADAAFAKALSLAPTDTELRMNWGAYLCARGQPREAMRELSVALADPLLKNRVVALTNAGKCSAELGDTEVATRYLREALRIQPDNALAAYSLALLEYRANQLPEASKAIKIALKPATPTPESLLLAACIAQRSGDKSNEAVALKQLANRWPASQEAALATQPGACAP